MLAPGDPEGHRDAALVDLGHAVAVLVEAWALAFQTELNFGNVGEQFCTFDYGCYDVAIAKQQVIKLIKVTFFGFEPPCGEKTMFSGDQRDRGNDRGRDGPMDKRDALSIEKV